jgi:hypothetical protein
LGITECGAEVFVVEDIGCLGAFVIFEVVKLVGKLFSVLFNNLLS